MQFKDIKPMKRKKGQLDDEDCMNVQKPENNDER